MQQNIFLEVIWLSMELWYFFLIIIYASQLLLKLKTQVELPSYSSNVFRFYEQFKLYLKGCCFTIIHIFILFIETYTYGTLKYPLLGITQEAKRRRTNSGYVSLLAEGLFCI